MSLDYNLTAIPDENYRWQDGAGDWHWHDNVQSIIFSTMAVDMGEITEANLDEYWRRYRLWNRAMGHKDTFLKKSDLRKMIGLRTNVHTTTPTQYNKHLIQIMEQETAYQSQV